MSKKDIYAEVTATITAALEDGVLPWRKDWTGGTGSLAMPRRATGEYYQGINVLLLWIASQKKGFVADQWMTFQQAKKLKANVRKGERGTQVVFFSTFEKETEQGELEKIPFLKSYTVFNVQQIENLPDTYAPADLDAIDTGARPIDTADAFFDATGARIVIDGTQPRYTPSIDTIHMPKVEQFETAPAFYGTLAHETIHWTGHKSRLDRLEDAGKREYAFEELIAELGACFTLSRLGIDTDAKNSAAYIGSWLKALADDKKFIFKAATAAQKATDFLFDLQSQAFDIAA